MTFRRKGRDYLLNRQKIGVKSHNIPTAATRYALQLLLVLLQFLYCYYDCRRSLDP